MSADLTLLPGNATAWERSNSTVSARLLSAPVALIQTERDPSRCRAQFVAPLAWERSVHFWDPDDDAGNRARIASSFTDHLAYGSPAALEAEIALDTGLTIEINEFWQLPGLQWPEFVVDAVINPGDPSPDLARVVASALRRKPPRDVLAFPRVFVRQPVGPIVVAAGSAVTVKVKVLPFNAAPSPSLVVGATTRVSPSVKVLPLKSI
jgi:phage tail P2-like protein